jgi:hypothetical protein
MKLLVLMLASWRQCYERLDKPTADLLSNSRDRANMYMCTYGYRSWLEKHVCYLLD